MKKWMLSAALVFLIASGSFAQTYFELMPSVGYTFNDRQQLYNVYGKVDGNINFGGSLMFNVNRLFGLELMYNHTSTTSGVYNYNSTTPISTANLGIDYILLGPVQTFNIPGSPVRPFIGAMLGASIFSPGEFGYGNDTKFTYGFQLGTNVYVTPRFGFRFKAQLLAPVNGYNEGYYVGQSNNPVYANIYQFSLNAGLVMGLGKVLPELRPRPHYRRPRYFRPMYGPYPY